MFEINNNKKFKDSVHGYVDVPKCFVENLMDNVYFQRLRNIEQTGMRILYPNAGHDRFSHSIGVFHLGSRAVDALLDNFSKDQYWNIESDNQSVLYWAKNKVLFLIACLLHDIGHAPFSHSLESLVLQNSKSPNIASNLSKSGNYITNKLIENITNKEKAYMRLRFEESDNSIAIDFSKVAPHEQMGALLIFDEFFKKQIAKVFDNLHEDSFPHPADKSILYAEYYQDRIVIDRVNEDDTASMITFEDDLCFIARMIMGIKYDDWRPERQIRNCFIELLNGDNFDVDKLDYIVRDTHMSGINNISLDVDRLINSLCIVTKTKYINKLKLNGKQLCNTTILSIKNAEENNELNIKGKFIGTFILEKGTEVKILCNSRIESLTNKSRGEAKIQYRTTTRAEFNSEANVTQNSEVIYSSNSENGEEKIQLLGNTNNKPFYTSIANAVLLSDFHFVTDEDVKLKIHENCNIMIKGKFHSESSIRVFEINDLSGDISEVEILADAFKYDFTKIKVPGKYGYNTFSIGFRKQAINVIANVIDARNYLFLWTYSHHKIIYYTNFLVPVLAKELFSDKAVTAFPDLRLEYNNIEFLDDTYIWTAFRYKYCEMKKTWGNKNTEIKSLLDELFTRNYKKSLYKSLAEFDLFFEKYDQNTIISLKEFINSKLINKNKNKRPFVWENRHDSKKKFVCGIF